MVAVARVLLESIKEVTVVDLLIATDLREMRLWGLGFSLIGFLGFGALPLVTCHLSTN